MEKHPQCQHDCECAGGCCDYHVPVGRCFSVRGGFLNVDQRVYVEQLLFGLKTVLQLVQVVDPWGERLFNAGSSCFGSIGELSGMYTDGAMRWACATPCSSGSVLISPEVMEHRVPLWIRPAPESVRVRVTHTLSRGHLMFTWRWSKKWKTHTSPCRNKVGFR